MSDLFDGFKVYHPTPKGKTWTFDGLFDDGVQTYLIRWLNWETGWIEIEYEDGTCMVVQGVEKTA